MSFASLTYVFFLAALAPVVAWGPDRIRRFVIIAGSLLFYSFWRVDFLALLLASVVVDYVFGTSWTSCG